MMTDRDYTRPCLPGHPGYTRSATPQLYLAFDSGRDNPQYFISPPPHGPIVAWHCIWAHHHTTRGPQALGGCSRNPVTSVTHLSECSQQLAASRLAHTAHTSFPLQSVSCPQWVGQQGPCTPYLPLTLQPAKRSSCFLKFTPNVSHLWNDLTMAGVDWMEGTPKWLSDSLSSVC